MFLRIYKRKRYTNKMYFIIIIKNIPKVDNISVAEINVNINR